MAFANLFTTYEMIEPPKGYLDDPKLKIRDIQESELPEYPFSLMDQKSILDNEFPGMINPFGEEIDDENPEVDAPTEPSTNQQAQNVVDLARSFMDRPYVWGSMDPDKGFDCSGLINYVYQQIGIQLPRTSHAMGKIGTEVQLSEVQPGDIIYTSSNGPSRGHVKMVTSVSDDGQISVIEAKGKKYGIVESILTNTSNIKSIRRVLGQNTQTVSPGGYDGTFYDRSQFVQTLTNTYKEVLTERGLDPDYAYILTASAAMESGWGTKVSGKFNYGGVKAKTGTVKSTVDYVNGQYIRRNQTFRDFTSVRDYCNYVITLLQNKRYNAFNTFSASKPFQFWRHVLDAGYGGGDTANKNSYMDSVRKIYSMIKRTIG